MVEHRTFNAMVAGSIPARLTTLARRLYAENGGSPASERDLSAHYHNPQPIIFKVTKTVGLALEDLIPRSFKCQRNSISLSGGCLSVCKSFILRISGRGRLNGSNLWAVCFSVVLIGFDFRMAAIHTGNPNATSDASAVIWRYMSFAAFVAMLQTKSLYFSSLRQLLAGDPFEGKVPLPAIANDHFRYYEVACRAAGAPITIDEYKDFEESSLRETVCVNCWHKSPHESLAMWRVYSREEGIAIRSTVSRLRASFVPDDESIQIGDVQYSEHEPKTLAECVLRKRECFRYEQEVRVWVQYGPGRNAGGDGIAVPMNPGILIESCVVSPSAPAWLHGVVEKELRLYGISAPVRWSTVLKPPIDTTPMLDTPEWQDDENLSSGFPVLP